MSELDVIVYRDPRSEREHQCPAHGYDGRLRTCKRRGCPRCGPRWASDWRRSMALNLQSRGLPVVLVSITAPGEERLPWDDAHCSHRRPHKHRGPAGCRVQERAAREWSDTVSLRWGWLRRAAQQAAKRDAGATVEILLRVWEPQKRGVPHLHLVLPYGTWQQIQSAHCFAAALKRLAGEYDFGYVDAKADEDEPWGVRLKPVEASEAARYLSSYLTGRNSKKKRSIRENIADPVMPRSLIWLTANLTSVAKGGTGCTIRLLRRARHLWAALEGRCAMPNWHGMRDAITVCAVYLQAYKNRPPPRDLKPALEVGADAERRSLARFGWSGTWLDRGEDMTRFAFELASKSLPREELAMAA